jgi:hypothetical protein
MRAIRRTLHYAARRALKVKLTSLKITGLVET